MIYLNSGIFKPALIIFSIIFCPLIAWVMILEFIKFSFIELIVAIVLLFMFLGILMLSYKISKSKEDFIKIDENCIEIRYPNVSNDGVLKIDINKIERFDYFGFSSLTSWLSLTNGLVPNSVFITYTCCSENKEVLIGHPDINEIKKLCQKINVQLVTH